eukprot:2715433-Pyramimonas_sp.AAC.1
MADRAAAAEIDVEADGGAIPNVDNGVGLRKHLLQLFKEGKLSATAVCSTSWHATNAGARGVSDLALHPDSTHHSDHLRRAINARAASSFYT